MCLTLIRDMLSLYIPLACKSEAHKGETSLCVQINETTSFPKLVGLTNGWQMAVLPIRSDFFSALFASVRSGRVHMKKDFHQRQ